MDEVIVEGASMSTSTSATDVDDKLVASPSEAPSIATTVEIVVAEEGTVEGASAESMALTRIDDNLLASSSGTDVVTAGPAARAVDRGTLEKGHQKTARCLGPS